MFVDSAKIYIKAGDGGNGHVSFHTQKYMAKGGPDGGDGGNGGHIIFQVDEGLHTLADFRYKRKYVAQSGKHGAPQNCTGKSAQHLVVKVPAGTVIRDAETGSILADLVRQDQEVILAKGGKGGAGNQHFATPTRQVPNFAKPGTEGQEKHIILELKLLADVGLVGFPNAGKSTMLSIVSGAKPKIGDYPFTTLSPNLGVVTVRPGESFIMADIPGLIEGAHTGVGLGHEFLRHIERTRILAHIVDMAGTDGRDPISDFDVIHHELKQYSEKLAQRPQIVVANKMDIPQAQENFERFKAVIGAKGYEIFSISAASTQGVQELMQYLSHRLKDLPPEASFEPEAVVIAPKAEEPYRITREGDEFFIDGEWIRRLVKSINFENHESLQYFQRSITHKGISDELRAMGIAEGDTVVVDGYEFEWSE